MGEIRNYLVLFNAADYIIFILIAISTLISVWRGFAKEALSLANWFFAFSVAQVFNENFSVLLQHKGILVDSPYRSLVSFVFLFFASLLLGSLVVKLISSTIKKTPLAAVDRLLGTAFGLLRGVLVVTLGVGIVRWVGVGTETSLWLNSVFIPYFLELEAWSRANFGSLLSG